MQDGIQSYQQGMVFWIQTTSNMYNRRDCSTSTADVTTANVHDNQMYATLVSSSSSVFLLPTLHYMIADPRYDDKKLYEYNKKTLGIDLICSVERYKSTSKKT